MLGLAKNLSWFLEFGIVNRQILGCTKNCILPCGLRIRVYQARKLHILDLEQWTNRNQ
jgi:hypothetical protein